MAAAEGQSSRLRRAAGIGTAEWRYRQTGIVTTVRHERPHCGIAVEHFLPAGPFSILPMTGHPSSPLWTWAPRLAPRPVHLPDSGFPPQPAPPLPLFLASSPP